MNLHVIDKDSSSTDEEDIDHVLIGMSTSSDDYHPTVAIHGSLFFLSFFLLSFFFSFLFIIIIILMRSHFFLFFCLVALMKILRDPSLSTHHTAVIQAVMFIFKTLGLKCVPFLSQIMPPFMSVMRSCPQGMIEFHFNKLSQLVTIVKQVVYRLSYFLPLLSFLCFNPLFFPKKHIRNYLEDIFALIKEYWTSNQVTIIALIKALGIFYFSSLLSLPLF